MAYRRRIFFTDKQKSEIWDRWQRGESKVSVILPVEHSGSSGWRVCPGSQQEGHIRTDAALVR